MTHTENTTISTLDVSRNGTANRPGAKSGKRTRAIKIWAAGVLACFFLPCVVSCGAPQLEPVEIYPEDMCSNCRMAVSEHAFASEIITTTGEVYKFDDLGCMEKYTNSGPEQKIAAKFVKDYESKKWLRFESSVIVLTGIQTPMGSGKVALKDSSTAHEYLARFPRKI